MILGTMIMAGLVGFYLSSQGMWLDASTQAITQREASLVAAAMRDSESARRSVRNAFESVWAIRFRMWRTLIESLFHFDERVRLHVEDEVVPVEAAVPLEDPVVERERLGVVDGRLGPAVALGHFLPRGERGQVRRPDLQVRLGLVEPHLAGAEASGRALQVGGRVGKGAAMGLTNLDQLDHLIAVNRRNFARYREALRGLPGVELLDVPEGARRNFQHVVLQVKEGCALHRDDLVEALWAENIIARRYFYPGCHRMEPYRSEKAWDLPITDRVAGSVVILPTGTAVGDAEVDAVAGAIRAILEQADAVRTALVGRPRLVTQAMRVV